MTADCQTDYDPHSLSLDDARTRILSCLTPVQAQEPLPLARTLHRVLAQTIKAPRDVPPYRNAAMDGFACRSCDLPNTGKVSLHIAGESRAGHAYNSLLIGDQAIRVTTGAVLPDNADAVIMQERTESSEKEVHFDVRDAQNKSFVRERGSDTRSGETVMQAGLRIGPAQIAVLASLGITDVNVHRKVRVAVLSTGDELVELGASPDVDQIFDSNRPALLALLENAQAEVIDLGICEDKQDTLRTTLLQAAKTADIIISSGGVSVGQADHLRAVLNDIGQLNFWKISIKPGRPLAFGSIDNCHYFGLPGNPVSTLVTFQQLVAPALKQLSGERDSNPEISLYARCKNPLKKQAGRQEFQRGVLQQDNSGELYVSSTGAQDSHILSSVSRANCLIDLPTDSTNTEVGERVRVHLL